MNALLQRPWRCCRLPRSQWMPFSQLQELLLDSFHGVLPTGCDASGVPSAGDFRLFGEVGRDHSARWLTSGQKTLELTSPDKTLSPVYADKTYEVIIAQKTPEFAVPPTILDPKIAQKTQDCTSAQKIIVKSAEKNLKWQHCFLSQECGWRRTQVRGFHISTSKHMENQTGWLPAGARGAQLSSPDSFLEPAELTEQEQRDIAVYEELKEFVMKKRGGKPEYLEMLKEYNPMAEHEEPSIVDFRPPNRELPPLDRVTIALETEEQYRVTRKTKWIVKQLRSPLINDVPSVLEQWVKTMYPKRSDWLDLLKEFDGEKEQELMFEIFEFALLEDTFEVKSQDLTKIIVKYINLERYDDVERLMGTLDSKGFPPDFVVCTLLLDMHCKMKRLDKAREMYDRIRSMGYVPDVAACTELIDYYCTSGNPEAGEMLLAEMEAEKVHGTVDTYLAVLRGYGKLGQVSEAVRIFGMIKQDVFLRPHMGPNVYSSLMNAYTQANMLPSAVLTMEDMLMSGLVPEDESVGLLIVAYEKKNQFEKALDVLLKLESKAVRPGVDTVTTLIGWFGKLGLVEEAEILFKNIEAKVDKPECKAYVTLFSTYARSGLIDKARGILGSLEEKKVVLTDWAYEQIILSLLDGKQPQEAQSMRDQMISRGYTPSDEIERALLGIQTESFLADVSKPLEEATQSSRRSILCPRH